MFAVLRGRVMEVILCGGTIQTFRILAVGSMLGAPDSIR